LAPSRERQDAYNPLMRFVVLAALLGACSFQHGVTLGDAPPGDRGSALDAMPDAAPLGPWGAPTMVAVPNPSNTDDDPSITDDRLELYINSSRDGNADVFVATRASTIDSWSAPTLVTTVSSTANETTPEIAYDGLSIVVASDRNGTTGGNDLWISKRASRGDPWSPAVRIAELSSTYNEAAGNITPDGLAVVLSSYRLDGSPDLFIATRATPTAAWNPPVAVASVNTTGHEGSPFLSADKLSLYFDTDRDGDMNIYVARRTSTTEPFGAPEPVTVVNTNGSEQDPWLSLDSRRLWFSSDRSGSNQLWEATR
jgi:Tol biopolymer transport system component